MLTDVLTALGALLVGAGSLIAYISYLQRNATTFEDVTKRGRNLKSKDKRTGRGAGRSSRSSSSSRVSRTSTTGTKSSRVKREEAPYWKRRGWKNKNGDLTGYYRTKYGTFKGKIENYRSSPQVYIYNPPKQLNDHPHGNCFFSKGGGKYKVHFKRKVDQPSKAIHTVEEILRESFNNTQE